MNTNHKTDLNRKIYTQTVSFVKNSTLGYAAKGLYNPTCYTTYKDLTFQVNPTYAKNLFPNEYPRIPLLRLLST